jgi:hypothetical protein
LIVYCSIIFIIFPAFSTIWYGFDSTVRKTKGKTSEIIRYELLLPWDFRFAYLHAYTHTNFDCGASAKRRWVNNFGLFNVNFEDLLFPNWIFSCLPSSARVGSVELFIWEIACQIEQENLLFRMQMGWTNGNYSV